MSRHAFFRLVAAGLLMLSVIGPGVADAARLFNGTSDCLQSATAVDLSAHAKITIAYWLSWDAFSTNNDLALEHGSPTFTAGNGSVIHNPNSGTAGKMDIGHNGNVGLSDKLVTQPSAGAWHHFVFNHDKTAAGAVEVAAVFIDGVSQALTGGNVSNNTNSFSSQVLFFMCRAGTSLFGAGRMAEVAIWGSYLFVQADVDNLYNAGNGRLATDVQFGSLVNYWRIPGTASPEPATVGGVSLTVNGTTFTAHPFTLEQATRPPCCRNRARTP